MFKSTCFDIWREEKERVKVLTLCKDLDDRLSGGVAAGLITEFCGAPGSGKTQICLQLCINVQFPEEVGGINGKAIYVDTNQGFNPERLNEMAHCAEKRFQRIFRKTQKESLTSAFTAISLMENITYMYCADHAQLKTVVQELRQMLSQNEKVQLIVIDSFSFPLRSIEDVTERTTLIYTLLSELQQLAMKNQIAIVITNELTTHMQGNIWKICPALGESHAHKINQRIILSKARTEDIPQRYIALLDKSHMLPKVAVPFVIKQSGIRGVS